jgi:hypothetical protein
VRDLDGRIVALLVRSDDPQAEARYSTISSKKYGGPGPGAPCHVPLCRGVDRTAVRLTEGVLKGDSATVLSGVLTLGLQGAASWRQALPLLARLRPQRVRLAFDADVNRKWVVAQALWQTAKALRVAGFTVLVERWEEARGKGIDDLLAVGRTPQVLEGAAMWEVMRAILRRAYAVDPALQHQRLLADGPQAFWSDRHGRHRLASQPTQTPWIMPLTRPMATRRLDIPSRPCGTPLEGSR